VCVDSAKWSLDLVGRRAFTLIDFTRIMRISIKKRMALYHSLIGLAEVKRQIDSQPSILPDIILK
jgi:hypothetical protein